MDSGDPGWRFLRMNMDEQLAEQAKISYDSKVDIWVPDPDEGFVKGEIIKTDGSTITVKTSTGLEKTLKKDEGQEINPPKFEKAEDMSNLTFLNDASVLHNLRQRYYSMMIYTYSGLFCVVINPYKRLPIYTESIAKEYMGRRRNEMPPHLFAVSDEAYRNMKGVGENQSMLITGESGAGKTENTKKVISYFATVGASQQKTDKKRATLEDQIIQTNPVLEALGNAKTVRNNNSSRFGKFIRIHFSAAGKVAGADISHYLLEKSRVIKQAPGERCYHIFYQLMSNSISGLREKLLLEDDIRKYHYVSQAELTVPGMDDGEEMMVTDEAFDIMLFTAEEKFDIYRLCASIMHMGEMKFKQRPREEQAEADGMQASELSSKLFTVEPESFTNSLLKPRVKVGTEWVNKGQNLEQVNWAVGALAKAIYARMFSWLISRCNTTLDAQELERAHFIGVLDIAGFEIFDLNSFEQLWINFVNEKLQQFFNHHMFVLEQEEYQREGIHWEFIDFGLDLQACIELIEKPLGVVSMLDEECIVPKASDMTLVSKLTDQHLGKHPNFQAAKPPKGKQALAHFAIVHYAGTVRYNANAWLEKNKDPLNDSAVAVLKSATDNKLLYAIWDDYRTQEDIARDAERGKVQEPGKKKGKAASFMTVSMMYRESLSNLMTMLYQTHPHFIRCIIPNEEKKSGVIDAGLVLNQLTCNGVLEGIRICRKGFPNRLQYPEFRHRYAILAADEAANSDPKVAGEKMMAKLQQTGQIDAEEFKIGFTKIFFKAGVLAKMEELRDEALSVIITKFQSACRGYVALCDYKRRLEQSEAVVILQENIRAWCTLRTWPWFRVYARVKPMLVGMKKNEEFEKLEAQLKETEEKLTTETEQRLHSEANCKRLEEENQALGKDLAKETELRKNAEKQAEELHQEVIDLEDKNAALDKAKKTLESDNATLNSNLMETRNKLTALETEKLAKDQEIKSLQEEMNQQDRALAKLAQERKIQEDVNRQLSDNLESETRKNQRLEGDKSKLEQIIADLQRELDQEKKAKLEQERHRKKAESEVKMSTDTLEQTRQQKHDLEDALKRREQDLSALKFEMEKEMNISSKMQISTRELIARIEQLEEELENEQRTRQRVERLKSDAQDELDLLTQRLEEANGALNAQMHINKQRKDEVQRLQYEIEERTLYNESHINELCNLQQSALTNLRDLSLKASALENEASHVLSQLH